MDFIKKCTAMIDKVFNFLYVKTNNIGKPQRKINNNF